MEHRGEIVEKAVRQSGYSITKLSIKMKKSRRWVYNTFENSQLSIDKILEIGKIINHDFSKEIKEINRSIQQNKIDPLEKENAEYWKNKYLYLLEEHQELIRKLVKKD